MKLLRLKAQSLQVVFRSENLKVFLDKLVRTNLRTRHEINSDSLIVDGLAIRFICFLTCLWLLTLASWPLKNVCVGCSLAKLLDYVDFFFFDLLMITVYFSNKKTILFFWIIFQTTYLLILFLFFFSKHNHNWKITKDTCTYFNK